MLWSFQSSWAQALNCIDLIQLNSSGPIIVGMLGLSQLDEAIVLLRFCFRRILQAILGWACPRSKAIELFPVVLFQIVHWLCRQITFWMQDTLQEFKSKYDAYEDIFFGKIKGLLFSYHCIVNIYFVGTCFCFSFNLWKLYSLEVQRALK